MKLRFVSALLIVFLWIAVQSVCADPSVGVVIFTGHYELADKKANHSFSLDITQTAAKADLSFSAAMADGSGAAPDGDGQGQMRSGVLTFTFKDSFENEGSGTLVKKKDVYHLTINVTKVVEPRPLRFYGEVLLRKTADKPQPP